MKKALLLASAALLISTAAKAEMNNLYNDIKPYIGADYAYDRLELKSAAKRARKNYNSAVINAGMDVTEYADLEAFYQFGGSRKSHPSERQGGGTKKFKFNAYGLDLYGYLPFGCEQKFKLLATAGAAVYDTELKYDGKTKKSKVGYRVGGGALYKLTDHVAARVVGRYGYIGSRDLDHVAEVTAGLRYSF